MYYNYNEFLVPVIVGCSEKSTALAKKLLRNKGLKAHIFCEMPSLIKRIRYKCHKVYPLSYKWLLESLISFASSLEEYYMPTIFVCDDFSRGFVEEYYQELEAAFVIVEDAVFFNGEKNLEE